MNATLQTLIEHYGYLAVLLGTFLEGETVLILAGFAAHLGHLELTWTIAAAFCGSWFGDQLYFFLGHLNGDRWLTRFPSWQPRARQVNQLLQRYDTPLILGIRFMYGLRIIGPFVMGMAHLSVTRFALLNGLGAFVWATLIGSAGFFLGAALETLLGDIQHLEMRLLLGVASVGLILGIIHWLRRGRRKDIR
ncbi:MAG: DedA family protein [Gammaproteobacteria bacterium]|nr:DedA family protein [Gammaproteobacteria bacterium]